MRGWRREWSGGGLRGWQRSGVERSGAGLLLLLGFIFGASIFVPRSFVDPVPGARLERVRFFPARVS